MMNNPFQSPGDADLNIIIGHNSRESDDKKPDSNAKPAGDHALTYGKGGSAAAKKTKEDREDAATKALADQEFKPTEAMVKANTPPKEVDDKQAIYVTISNCKWNRDRGAYGDTVIARMDVHIPPAQEDKNRIMVGVELLKSNGNWEAIGQPVECHAKAGKAECDLTLPQPPKTKDGTLPDQAKFRFTAKHTHSEKAVSPSLEAVPGTENLFESVVYYSPTRKQYHVCLTLEEYNTLHVEFEKLRALQGKTRQMLEAKDPSVRKKLGKEIDEAAETLFEGKLVGDSKPVLEAMILIRKPIKWANPPSYAYIRPHANGNETSIKGKWYKETDEEVKKNLSELLKKSPGSKEHTPFFSTDVKCTLFKVPPLKGQWPIKWNIKEEKDGQALGQTYTFSKEAIVCQYAMGFDGLEATGSVRERTFHLGTGGHASYDLIHGKATGSFPWPENGVNILTLLKQSPYLDAVLAKNRKCLMRLNITLKADAFIGITVAGALNILNLDLSKEALSGKTQSDAEHKSSGPTLGSGAEAKGFAGAKATTGIEVAVEWTAPDRGPKFESLGNCGMDIGVSAGVGAEADWKIEYKHGVFHFHGNAGLTFALGCKGKFSFELGMVEGCHFIGYLFHCMDYHFIVDMDLTTFTAYKNIAFTIMTVVSLPVTAEAALANEVITHFPSWYAKLERNVSKVKQSLTASSYQMGALTNVPPEAMGQALLTIMKTREPDDFRSIKRFLYSTLRRDANVKADPSCNHKLKWTIRSVGYIEDPNSVRPETEAEREAALKKGIKRIMDFGYGIGYVDENGDPQGKNDSFLAEFQGILKKYEVH